jgi:hypothetical protein
MSIPIQFGGGRETIWPSEVFSLYDVGFFGRMDRLKSARTLDDWHVACNLEDLIYTWSSKAVQPIEVPHITYAHEMFCREAKALKAWLVLRW